MKKLIIIFIVFIIAIIGGGIYGYITINANHDIKLAELQNEVSEYETLWDSVGGMITGYAVADNQTFGKKITEDDLYEIEVAGCNAQNVITNLDELEGKYYRINLTGGTILTTDTVMDFALSSDERAYDVITNYNPIGLEPNDFVDIRILMPLGEDYIALSHKRVEGIYGGVLKLVMSEYDIAVYNSLVVDSILIPGSIIYTTKYLEPGAQDAATSFYPVSTNVLYSTVRDPNMTAEIDPAIIAARRQVLEETLLVSAENELLKVLLESGKGVISSKILQGESEYQSQKAIEEQKRLEAELNGG